MTSDSAIPDTPTITATGPGTFPVNYLTFETTPFSDPQGAGTFAAVKWRIGEITDETNPGYDPAAAKRYEITAAWESAEITEFQNDIQIPASVVQPGHTYRVRCRMQDTTGRWSHWSAPVEFITSAAASVPILEDLRLTELMYDPVGGSEYEFIELKNTGPGVLDLTDVSFVDGITFAFAGSSVTSLDPGAYVLVVRTLTAFESRYGGGLNVAGEYTGQLQDQLANGGERIKLADYWNGTIVAFAYDDGRGWPLAADGGGHSLVPLDAAMVQEPNELLSYGGNWRASTYINGSPGVVDPAPATGVVLNEIMAHTDYAVPPYESNDWIEVYNPTGSPVALIDWYLSDDLAELQKWAIPAAVIGGHSVVSFDEVTGFNHPPGSGFGLDKDGERLYLSHLPGSSVDRIVDCLRFKGQENGVSLGRYPDGGPFWFSLPPTRDGANIQPNPPLVVIDEIMYHPPDAHEEYLELSNPTGGTVALENAQGSWRLRMGGNNYDFPPGTSIDPGQRLIVVGFDPAGETARLDAFESAYGTGELTAGTDIVGPWPGNLANGGERVAVERPQAPDALGDPVSWVIIDEVIYYDQAPWPPTADGLGDALQRLSTAPQASGNDPANWQAAGPTPAAANP
jgi:hypothetical protein